MSNRTRLSVEVLEGRALPSTYTASSVGDLIADINAANQAGGSNTINLAPGARFSLTAVDNRTDGPTGLPVIAARNNLTIIGNGDIVERSTASTWSFRLFDVAAGASLTLRNMTVQGGEALGTGSYVPTSNRGGGIFRAGALTLDGVTIQNNMVLCNQSPDCFGGGIYSTGSLTVTGGAILNNQAHGDNPYSSDSSTGSAFGGGVYAAGPTSFAGVAISGNLVQGSNGRDGYRVASQWGGYSYYPGGKGGDAFGGGVCFSPSSGSTALVMTGCTLSSNSALGGNGGAKGKGSTAGNGGNALGGGLYVGSGTATLTTNVDTANTAQGGHRGSGFSSATDGLGEGGAVYIAPGATVSIDAYTLSHFSTNKASTAGSDVYGTYTAT